MKILLRIVGTVALVIAVVEFFRSASLALSTNSNPHASNTTLVVAGVLVLVGILILVVSLFTDYFTFPSYYHAKAYSHYRDSSEEYRDYRQTESTGYDPYYILDLTRSSSDSEVKTRFKDLSRRYHSDTAGVKGTDHLFNEVQKAYKDICKERGL